MTFAEGFEIERATNTLRQFEAVDPRLTFIFRQKLGCFLWSTNLGWLLFGIFLTHSVVVQIVGASKAFT